MWWLILVAFVVAIGYRAWKYRAIKRAGHDVRWESPLARWFRRRP